MDITPVLRNDVRNGELHVISGNDLAGRDPALMVQKETIVIYQINGVTKNVTAGEHQRIDIPEDSSQISVPPPYEFIRSGHRSALLLARSAGEYTLIRSNGSSQRVVVSGLSKPVSIAGPWILTFPPRLGAPAKVVIHKLISWPKSANTGIKYFSGTATYTTTFNFPSKAIGSNKESELDLGDVQVIADVRLNGHELGIEWKPPFRVDVTQYLRVGKNKLQVQVTNLWPNRLIGDEQYPDDARYTAAGNIAVWPQWVLNGSARPEPRRIAFTTWKLWHKGDNLLPSGLIGPVRIETATEVPISNH